MGKSYPDRTNARGIWNVNEISKDKILNGNWPGNFGTPGGRGMFGGGLTPSNTIQLILLQSQQQVMQQTLEIYKVQIGMVALDQDLQLEDFFVGEELILMLKIP